MKLDKVTRNIEKDMQLKDEEERRSAKMDMADTWRIFLHFYLIEIFNGTKVNDQIIRVFTC